MQTRTPLAPRTSSTPLVAPSMMQLNENAPLGRTLYHANTTPDFTPDLPAFALVHNKRISLETNATIEQLGPYVVTRLHEVDTSNLVFFQFLHERCHEVSASTTALEFRQDIDMKVRWIVLEYVRPLAM